MGEHETLPLPEYDHLPLDTLRHRIRQLDEDGVLQLLEYERSHAHRLPVIEVLENWLAELRQGARPSDGSPYEIKPELAPPPAGRSSANPAKAVEPAPPNPRRQ